MQTLTQQGHATGIISKKKKKTRNKIDYWRFMQTFEAQNRADPIIRVLLDCEKPMLVKVA